VPSGNDVTIKDMVRHDLPDLCPGLTRAAVEHVQSAFEGFLFGTGRGLASDLASIAPLIAQRIRSLEGRDLEEYVRILNSAAVLVLQMWTANGKAPRLAAVEAAVTALDG
jgi:hypothetical protein